jgi:hypothetical protein
MSQPPLDRYLDLTDKGHWMLHRTRQLLTKGLTLGEAFRQAEQEADLRFPESKDPE